VEVGGVDVAVVTVELVAVGGIAADGEVEMSLDYLTRHYYH